MSVSNRRRGREASTSPGKAVAAALAVAIEDKQRAEEALEQAQEDLMGRSSQLELLKRGAAAAQEAQQVLQVTSPENYPRKFPLCASSGAGLHGLTLLSAIRRR